MLASFLAATYREVVGTLLRAAEERATGAAEQIAGMMVRSLRESQEESAQLRVDPDLRACLRNPSDRTREAAAAVLMPLTEKKPRRVELWNNEGSLLLEIITPGPGKPGGRPISFPRAERLPPARE